MKITTLIIATSIIALAISSNGDASQIIDWIGAYKSSATPWEVTVNQDKPPEFILPSGVMISPSAWRPHKGWFVFIQDDKHLWAFDGSEKLLLLQIEKIRSALYDLHSMPYIPPTNVLDKLPESFRTKVESKFNKT